MAQSNNTVTYEGLEFPELPYVSNFAALEPEGLPDAEMHYLEGGNPEGDPILFLHGNPTWSYLWRNVMPHLEGHGRLIAPDLIGFGRSDKPDIGYRFGEHVRYLEGFIDTLELTNITLVIHDWGSGLGFDYAARHPDKVKGVVFMEAMIPPVPLTPVGELPEGVREFFTTLRTPDVGENLVLEQNFFVEEALFGPAGIRGELSEEEKNAYRAPFPTPETRLPTLVWPREIPFGGEPADNAAVFETYIDWLKTTDTPMLYFHVTPGVINPPEALAWAQENIRRLGVVSLGEGVHFVQEDYPDEIGQGVARWLSAQGR